MRQRGRLFIVSVALFPWCSTPNFTRITWTLLRLRFGRALSARTASAKRFRRVQPRRAYPCCSCSHTQHLNAILSFSTRLPEHTHTVPPACIVSHTSNPSAVLFEWSHSLLRHHSCCSPSIQDFLVIVGVAVALRSDLQTQTHPPPAQPAHFRAHMLWLPKPQTLTAAIKKDSAAQLSIRARRIARLNLHQHHHRPPPTALNLRSQSSPTSLIS
jgi:hypothetical protein